MALTPEQREAWEQEKAQRAKRKLEDEEALKNKQEEINRIDQAIDSVEKQERRKKLFIVGIIVGIYALIGIGYLVLR